MLKAQMRAELPKIEQAAATLFETELTTVTGINSEENKYFIYFLVIEVGKVQPL